MGSPRGLQEEVPSWGSLTPSSPFVANLQEAAASLGSDVSEIAPPRAGAIVDPSLGLRLCKGCLQRRAIATQLRACGLSAGGPPGQLRRLLAPQPPARVAPTPCADPLRRPHP